MARVKSYKFHKLVKTLRKYDSKFEIYSDKGKGSHRMIYHPDIQGRPVSFPIICHGEGSEVPQRIIKGLIRAFKLQSGVL